MRKEKTMRRMKGLYYRLIEDEDGDSLVYVTWGILFVATLYALVICGMGLFHQSKVASEFEKSRMAYHGVQYAEQDHKGKLWFYRNGERIELR